MPKFVCRNKECGNLGKIEHYTKITYKWNVDTKRLEAEESFCKVCGKFREPEKESGQMNIWHKAERHKNYDNKQVKQYDYDRGYFDRPQEIEVPKKLNK